MTEVIELAPVDKGALLVLIMLADSADERSRECWPSISNIAKRARLSDRQVQYCLKELADAGLIHIEVNSGRSGTNLYRITRHETWGGAKTAGVKPIAPGGVQSTSPGGVKPIAPEPSIEPSIEPSTREREQLDLLSEEDGPPKTDRFDEFWKVYPKKAGKPAAHKAWVKAVKCHDPAKIIAAAKVYAGSDNVARGFAKHPQGWLNDERFNDADLQPPPPRQAQPFRYVQGGIVR